RRRLLMFGGMDLDQTGDLLAMSLDSAARWTPVLTLGSHPPERYHHTAIYDPVRDRIVIFGGQGQSPLNDVWALSLGTPVPQWSQLVPAGLPPSPRQGASAIYDPNRDGMIVFGGGGYSDDAWILSLGGNPAWQLMSPSGLPPTPRAFHTAVYDSLRGRMLIFGGTQAFGLTRDPSTVPAFADVWGLSLKDSLSWNRLNTGVPAPAMYAHTAILDPVSDRMVAYGGYTSDGMNVWTLSLSGSPSWQMLAPLGPAPSPR